jgi:mRNA interferase RelE/StbE
VAIVKIPKAAQDDIRRLDRAVQAQVAKRLRILEANPEHGRPLGADLAGLRRITVGNRQWRIVYVIAAPDIVIVWCVGNRAHSEVYKEAARRVVSLPHGPMRDDLKGVLVEVGRMDRLQPLIERLTRRRR